MKKRRRESCDLYYFEDTGSSGMDNSPVSGYHLPHLDGSDTCFIDLACQQALSAMHLSKICKSLGLTEKSSFYKSENERICDLINKYHYSDKTGWHYNFFARGYKGERVKLINTKTLATSWALISGVAKDDRARRVIEHLFNENGFYTKIPFA